MNPLSPIHPAKRQFPPTSSSLRFGETSTADDPNGTGEYVEKSGGLSVADKSVTGTRRLPVAGYVGSDGGSEFSDSLGNADFVLNLGSDALGSQSKPGIKLPKRLASSDSPGLKSSASHDFPSLLKPVIDEFRRTGGGSTSVQALHQGNVSTSIKLKPPGAGQVDTPAEIDPQGTGPYIPAVSNDPAGTVDFVPLAPHELPTGAYVPAIENLDFNPITADYLSDEMRGIIFGPKRLSVPDITQYVVNHPEYEKRLRSPLLKVLRYEDRTPVYSNEPETDAIDLLKLTDDDVAYVKKFFTLDQDIPTTNSRPKRQVSAYLDLIRQTDIARFKRATVDEYYKPTPEELEMKPDEEAMRKRFVLMKAYRALGQKYTSIFDNTISSDLTFDSMFPPGQRSRFGVETAEKLHVPLEIDRNSLSGAELFTDDEINEYRAKEVPPMTSSEQIELAKIREEMRRGQRNTLLALAASVFLAVSGVVTAGYFALRPSANTPDANAVASLDRPDLNRPELLNPPRIKPPFDPNAPKADDVLIDPEQFKEIDKIITAMRVPPLGVIRNVYAGTPTTVSRASVNPTVSQQHASRPMYLTIRGNGTGHVIDVSDNPGQTVQLYEFGPGDVEINGAFITIIDKCANTRITSRTGPYYGIMIPRNTISNMKSIEFEGTHIVPDLGGTFETTRASNAEIAALRNPKLTQKVILKYPNKPDEIILFTYPGCRPVAEARAQAPDIANFIGIDNARRTRGVMEAVLVKELAEK